MRQLLVIGVAVATWVGGSLAWAAATLPEPAWQADWSCGQAVTPDRKLVQGLLDAGELHGYAVNGVTLPVLVGERMEGMGTVVFIQQAGQ